MRITAWRLVGLDERAWLDNRGNPKSFHARIEETWRRIDANTLELQLTLHDPEYHTAPYVGSKKTYKRIPREAVTYFGWYGLFAGVTESICAPMNEVEGYNKEIPRPGPSRFIPTWIVPIPSAPESRPPSPAS